MTNHQSYPPGEIPPGITFGSKVVEIPPTSHIFNRALWIQACIDNPKSLHESYTWVKRGDNLVKFTILYPKTGIPIIDFFARETKEIFLMSPVSGLLIHSSHGYGDDGDSYCHTSLLLPDDEPTAENGRYIFSDLCNFCWDYREYIFYKPSEFKKGGFFNDQKLKEAFEEQQSRLCQYVDAMPKYGDYFCEARTRHSQLRPYLKHLL